MIQTMTTNGPVGQATPEFLPFLRLPPEIRDLIWEETLPLRRLFHVRGIENAASRSIFTFHVHNPPPVATSVCKESRDVALTRGLFLSSGPTHAGVWFNPQHDVLYFDRNMRNFLRSTTGRPPTREIVGWDRVIHVGIEWRAFFRDAPRLELDEDMRLCWQAAIYPLYARMPQMSVLHYVLPVVRHKGGIAFGREPHGAAAFAAELEPLPMETKVPWSSRRRGMTDDDMDDPDLVMVNADSSTVLRPWEKIKREMEQSLQDAPLAEDQSQGARGPPHIVGWWLRRKNAPTTYDNPQVREFLH